MSDFLLDFRPIQKRNMAKASSFLKYFPDIQIFRLDEPAFSLVLTRCDNHEIWGPYTSIDNNIFVAIAGRIALESNEWNDAKSIPGKGGLACKSIFQSYGNNGISGLKKLNGSYIVMIFDKNLNKFFIVSDKCGMFPFFKLASAREAPVFSSHQDLLASLASLSEDFNTTSFCEFLMTGQVSYPFTYYNGVIACEFASIHTLDLETVPPIYAASTRYFDIKYTPDNSLTGMDFAERLASAFKNSLRRRTHSIFGTTAIGLSGGLDSRMILSACPEPSSIKAFCFYDEENLEYRTARKIAKANGINLIPFKRDFEHYGKSADLGIKISGGTSNFLTNHILGFREKIRNEGLDNIITGLYCDYFFKGLCQNRQINSTSNTISGAFNFEWYLKFIYLQTKEGRNVKKRLETIYPVELQQNTSDIGRLEIEGKRLFPLFYEPENAEVLIPQRVIGWNMPILDNDVLDVYFQMPLQFKFDRLIYEKMVKLICGEQISKIPNSNTGEPIGVSNVNRHYHSYIHFIENTIYKIRKRLKPQISTPGSWPNFEYYIHNSRVIAELWTRKNPIAHSLLGEILGYDPFHKSIPAYKGRDNVLFQRLLTLKTWLDQKKI